MGIQVEELTRNLMPWGKEYIDFSFAGRHISEFGLVAVTNGDRYQFAGSPDFEDETSNVNGVWGQYYWGTNFKTKTYSYSLATDGMTERQFEDFKYHFRPGHYGQFYEDAWFDRYCYVRIKAVIDFSFIPFQKEAEVAGIKFQSRVYKGECKISFIQDRPFMYSFYQVLNSKIADLNAMSDNGKAAARVMYNSNIPARDSWTKNIKCATGSWFSLPVIKKIVKTEKNEDGEIKKRWTEYEESDDNSIVYKEASFFPYYNPSTIETEANIEFTIQRSFSKINFISWEPVYFNEIYDLNTKPNTPYNTFSITNKISVDEGDILTTPHFIKKYKYGLPEISSEINKAIEIAWQFYQENPRGVMVDLQEKLQEELINSKVLIWTIKVLQKIQVNQDLYYATEDEQKISVGMLIDGNSKKGALSDSQLSTLDLAREDTFGEVVFHSGDYQNRSYEEDDDIPGCFKTSKINVYASALFNDSISVDWFGYFNIMMLMMFSECPKNNREDITTEGVFGNFYPYTLRFQSDKGMAFISYKYNYLEGDGLMNTRAIQDENCSNIMASDYLRLEGGDTIDISTGKIATYHILGFNRGEDEQILVKNVKLEYKYTYV